MKPVLFLLLFSGLFPLAALSQQADGIYFDKLPPIAQAFFSHDFKSYKFHFYNEYRNWDTTDKTRKFQYINDVYFLAEILASENKKDSVITILESIVHQPIFDNADGILGSVAFNSIRSDKRWKNIEKSAKDRLMKEAAAYKKKELRVQLIALHATDQSNFIFSRDSISRTKVIKGMLDTLTKIFAQHGYPGLIDVGKSAAFIPALILLHADLSTQLKYRDMIREEGLKGNIPGGNAGVLLDKIQVQQKGTQLYGSQYTVGKNNEIRFYPIEDSVNIEKRRKAMHFTVSYKDYLSAVRNQFDR